MMRDPLSSTLSAFADPTRRAILARLAQGKSTVNELAEPFEISLPAMSRHLGALEGAGLMDAEAPARFYADTFPGSAVGAAHRAPSDYPSGKAGGDVLTVEFTVAGILCLDLNRGGNAVRDTEILTVRDGKLVAAEAYFGWSLPHEAPAGGFINPDK